MKISRRSAALIAASAAGIVVLALDALRQAHQASVYPPVTE